MSISRTISSWSLLLTGIGSIIGSGWLFGPLYAAQIAGPASVISWILGGIVMIVIALTFAELGTAFPVAGGMVQYAEFSHGPLISFIIGWMVWISSVAVAPVETLGLLQYASNYIPLLGTQSGSIKVLSYYGIFAGAVLMFFMCILNFFGAKFFSKSNNIITLIKLIVPITTIIILIITSFHTSNFINPKIGGFIPFGWHSILSVLPLGGVIYSFIGANTILQLAGETKCPERSIPLAIVGSVGFCIILYGLLQIVFIGSLDNLALIHGWKNLSYSGDNGPFAGMLMTLGLGWAVIVLYADAFISPFGTAFIFTAATARVNFGLSKIGFFPKNQQTLTKKGVPLFGLLLNYAVGLLLFLPFPGWQEMVSFIISCFIFSFIIGPISLVALRKRLPDHKRPFKLPFATGICLIAFYFCNLLIFWAGWQTVSRMIIVILIGFIFFNVHCMHSKKSLWKNQWKVSWWLIPYISFMTLISYYGSFGDGLGLLPFGCDFLVIAFVSLVIFFLAYVSSQQGDPILSDYKIANKVKNNLYSRMEKKFVIFPILNRWLNTFD